MTDILKHDTSFCMFISGYGRFLTFFYFGHVFTFFNVFYFPNVFYFKKNVGKVQSGKRVNKKHFQNNSNEKDL